jgi:hypothetical protein
MIKNLRVYACSHGKVGSINAVTSNEWYDEGSFGWHLAKKLNLNFINNSQPGASNYHIFKRIYKDLPYITEEDLVLVQWSYIDRAYYKEFETIMPHTPGKISRVYYKYLYQDTQEANKVFGYTTLVQSMIPNFYFNFCNGSDLMYNCSTFTFKKIKENPGFLNINRTQLSMLFPNELIDGFHFNKKGHELLAERYFDIMSPLLYK